MSHIQTPTGNVEISIDNPRHIMQTLMALADDNPDQQVTLVLSGDLMEAALFGILNVQILEEIITPEQYELLVDPLDLLKDEEVPPPTAQEKFISGIDEIIADFLAPYKEMLESN